MSIVRRLRSPAIMAACALALTACNTDPAVWNGIAQGLDQTAQAVANDPLNCPMIPDGNGGVMRYCAPRMATDQYGNVIVPDRRHDRRDRDRDRRKP